MGGLACAEKIRRNYGILAAEATALATPGTRVQQEAAALAAAAQAMCMAYTEAYGDPLLDDDAKATLLALMRSEGDSAIAFASRLRSSRDHGHGHLSTTGAAPEAVIRAHRDEMVQAFSDCFAALLAEYYPSAVAHTEGATS